MPALLRSLAKIISSFTKLIWNKHPTLTLPVKGGNFPRFAVCRSCKSYAVRFGDSQTIHSIKCPSGHSGYPFNPVLSFFSLLTFFCFFTSEIKKQKKVSMIKLSSFYTKIYFKMQMKNNCFILSKLVLSDRAWPLTSIAYPSPLGEDRTLSELCEL